MKNRIMQALLNATRQSKYTGIYPKTVSVAACYDVIDHEVIMTISWSMPELELDASDVDIKPMKGIKTTVFSRPADSAIEIQGYDSLVDLEIDLINAAWTLGAYDLCRLEMSPLPVKADPYEAGRGIASSFGINPYLIMGSPLLVGDQSCERTIENAASNGFIKFRFVPLALSKPSKKQHCLKKDVTLNDDCSRDDLPKLTQQKLYKPRVANTGHEHIYQFGKKWATHGR